MAYVAVSGGEEAIEASIRLLDYYRSGTEQDLDLAVIEEKMSLLVDRVMSEAGLYNKRYAALALKQCEGSPDEAVFLLRAYRSTLKRSYDSRVADTQNMRLTRRISRRTANPSISGILTSKTSKSGFCSRQIRRASPPEEAVKSSA